MVKSCVICNNRFEPNSTRSFHTLPKDLALKKQWCQVVGLNINTVSKFDVVCSDHFSSTDVKSNPSGTKRYLVKGAVPSIASSSLSPNFVRIKLTERMKDVVPERQQSKELLQSSTDSKISVAAFTSTTPPISITNSSSVGKTSSTTITTKVEELEKEEAELKRTESPPCPIGDCSLDDMNSPTRSRRSWINARKTISRQKKIIYDLKRKNKRLKSKIYNMISLMKYLREIHTQG